MSERRELWENGAPDTANPSKPSYPTDTGKSMTMAAQFGYDHRGLRGYMGYVGLKESLNTGEVIERPDLVTSFKEQNELMGLNDILNLDRRFSTDEQHKEKYETNLDHVANVLKSS